MSGGAEPAVLPAPRHAWPSAPSEPQSCPSPVRPFCTPSLCCLCTTKELFWEPLNTYMMWRLEQERGSLSAKLDVSPDVSWGSLGGWTVLFQGRLFWYKMQGRFDFVSVGEAGPVTAACHWFLFQYLIQIWFFKAGWGNALELHDIKREFVFFWKDLLTVCFIFFLYGAAFKCNSFAAIKVSELLLQF